jgi:hypothetical protein
MAARTMVSVKDESESAAVRVPVNTRATAAVMEEMLSAADRTIDIAARATVSVSDDSESATVRT